MENRLLTANEFIQNHTHLSLNELLIRFAQGHVREALKSALEEVPYGGSDLITYEDVKGILTCYPPENVK